MRRLSLAGVIVGMLLTAGPALAHHAFAAEFDANQPVALKGTLTKMEWTNPHGWIFVDVKGTDGKVVNWAIEAGSPNAMLRKGLRRTDFTIGSEVVISGFRAKNGTPSASGRTVKFADGRNFFMGSTGTGAPDEGPGEK
jgi:hypothetical protein